MFGMKELKEWIFVTPDEVVCPVRDCETRVPRQRMTFKRDNKFMCPQHNIYISPTTFEYEDWLENILWKGKDDIELLRQIMKVKRESRMGRDNSEDSLTWNVFRFHEKRELVIDYIKTALDASISKPQLIYCNASFSTSSTGAPAARSRAQSGGAKLFSFPQFYDIKPGW